MTDLAVESYNGIPVRVVMTDIGKAIPTGDVAKSLGCSRQNVQGIINDPNNSHLFKGATISCSLPTASGRQDHVCLNESALVSLLMRISVGKSGTLEGKDRIEKFQIWARDILTHAQKSGVGNPDAISAKPAKRLSVTAAVREGKAFARETHKDPHDSVAAALLRHGYEYYIPILPSSNILMPPKAGEHRITKDQQTIVPDRPLIESITEKNMTAPSPKPDGMLNATNIGKIIKKTAEQVNQCLYNNKFIVYDADNPGEWRITELGRAFGTEEFYRPHPANKGFYRVFWHEEVLKRVFNYNQPVVPDAET